MLNFKKTLNVTGSCMIGETMVEYYNAIIESDNPSAMSISRNQYNAELYKANRTQCRNDYSDFLTMVYELQDEMIAELEDTQNATEDNAATA